MSTLDPRLNVNEIYGPVFQGEGATLGQPCVFLRMAGCNLACSWCDSAFTWDWKRFTREAEVHPMTCELVANKLFELLIKIKTRPGGDVPFVVVTGGEPLLQQRLLREVQRLFIEDKAHGKNKLGYVPCFEFETAGTIMPEPFVFARYNVSPKLATSGNVNTRISPAAMEAFVILDSVFKFVAVSEADLDEIDKIVVRFQLRRVYIMPEGTDSEVIAARLRTLAPLCAQRGYSITPRLHSMLYGKKRGV